MPAKNIFKYFQTCMQSRLVAADRQFDAQCHVVTSVTFSVCWAGLNPFEDLMISIFGPRVAEV